jgi:hypothetical protein
MKGTAVMTTNVIDSQIETLAARKQELVGKAGKFLVDCENASGAIDAKTGRVMEGNAR